jgi:hypothetical protein
MNEIIDKKFYLGPKFGTLFNKKWITISELLHNINSNKKCNVESLPHDGMAGLVPNLQLASITTQHKRPQCQIFKNEKK